MVESVLVVAVFQAETNEVPFEGFFAFRHNYKVVQLLALADDFEFFRQPRASLLM